MNKKFTKLMAALALLVFMMPSLAGWGQVPSAAPANGYSYVVAYYANNKYYALPHGTNASVWDATEVSLNSVNKVDETAAASLAWTLTEGSTSGQFYLTYTSGTNTYYLYKNGGTSNTNYNIKGTTSASERHYWEFTLNTDDNNSYAVKSLKANTGNTIYLGYATVGKFGVYSNITNIILLEIGNVPTVPYTVTLGDNNTTLTESSAGAGVTLPSRPDVSPYTFAGWSLTNLTEETTTATIIPAGEYHPTTDITLYPVYSRTESGATTWTKVVSSSVAGHPSGITEGVYALLTGSDKAFNGEISSGHGQSTTNAFEFTDNVATSAPTGTCEITMIPVMNGDAVLGYKMFNADHGYLYASAASSGKLAWHNSEDSYWNYITENYFNDWGYVSNNAHLRVYNDSFRTYAGNNGSQIKVARKGTTTTTYYISVVSITFTVTYNANGGTGDDFVDNNGGEGYESGAIVTVLANEGTNNPSFTKTGHEFAAWSDMEDGNDDDATLYFPDDEDYNTFLITANTVLYAQWDVVKYNVAIASVANVDLYAEYGTEGLLVEGEEADIDYGTTLTLTADGLAQGSVFVWQVTDGDNNDVTDEVLNGNVLTVPAYDITISGSVVLNYMVIFDSNGVETIVSQAGDPVFSLTAPTNVPTGFTFVGWTMYDGVMDVDNVLEGETIDLTDYSTDNASLYAVFSGEVGAFPATPPAAGSFVKVTETPADGWAGEYLIVYEDFAFEGFEALNVLNSHYGNTNANTYGTYTDLYQYYDNGVIEYNSTTSSYTITIAATANGYSLYDNDDEAYLGNNSSATGSRLRWDTQFTNSTDEWTLGVNSIVSVYNSEYAIRWNSNDPRFAIYKTNGQSAIQLYKYVEGAPGAPAIAGTTQRFIRVFQNETAADDVFILGPSIIPTGYYLDMGDFEILSEDADMFIIEDGGQLISDQDEVYATVWKNIRSYNNGGGWNFVASPIFYVADPDDVGMITTSVYDLYRFNPNVEPDAQGVTKEWENYKVQAHQNDFMLYNGHGYLYANEEDVILQFSGVVNSPDAVVSYDYDENSESELKDWHLVGNPYMYEAYPNMSYYVVSGFGIAEPETSGTVAPCEGIMIQGTDGSVNFTREPEETSAPSNLQMTLAQQVVNRETVSSTKLDKAIISFNEGSQLGKFYFGESAANIYIPQNDKEYAIVSTEAQGEMPVNFKAKENGTYTLSMNVENVDMNYLHLIDNMTGMDVDLLQTPSYTFEANTNDYANRFKLVFAANGTDEADESSFAFFSNGNLIVNNEGNATLQVIDINGRILSSETISGSCSKAINATTGVYMLRLINGENVKVQKVVVR